MDTAEAESLFVGVAWLSVAPAVEPDEGSEAVVDESEVLLLRLLLDDNDEEEDDEEEEDDDSLLVLAVALLSDFSAAPARVTDLGSTAREDGIVTTVGGLGVELFGVSSSSSSSPWVSFHIDNSPSNLCLSSTAFACNTFYTFTKHEEMRQNSWTGGVVKIEDQIGTCYVSRERSDRLLD